MEAFTALAAMAATAASSVPAWVPTAAAIAGSAVTGAAAYGQSKQQGAMAKATGDRNAAELERAANEKRAEAARKAAMQRERADQVLSRQTAVGAAGGAGTANEGFLDTFTDTAQRGAYYSDLAIASGENEATGLEDRANWSRAKGSAEQSQYNARANTALVKTGFDIAGAGLKRAPMATSDDLIDYNYDDSSGWATTTRRKTGGRYYS